MSSMYLDVIKFKAITTFIYGRHFSQEKSMMLRHFACSPVNLSKNWAQPTTNCNRN